MIWAIDCLDTLGHQRLQAWLKLVYSIISKCQKQKSVPWPHLWSSTWQNNLQDANHHKYPKHQQYQHNQQAPAQAVPAAQQSAAAVPAAVQAEAATLHETYSGTPSNHKKKHHVKDSDKNIFSWQYWFVWDNTQKTTCKTHQDATSHRLPKISPPFWTDNFKKTHRFPEQGVTW